MAIDNSITNVVKFGQKFIAGDSKRVVSALELHAWLEVKTNFQAWIDRRASEYGFEDNNDFLLVVEKAKGRGRPRKTYWLTVDMAKELSMLEKNEKGHQARKYFIECEKIAKAAKLPLQAKKGIVDARMVITYANSDVQVTPLTVSSANMVIKELYPNDPFIADTRGMLEKMQKVSQSILEAQSEGAQLINGLKRSLAAQMSAEVVS